MGKINTKKYNPKNHINDKFINLLFLGIKRNQPTFLSQALIYKNIGDNLCKDCRLSYEFCKCEGSREDNRFACEECDYNYCLCEYGINSEGVGEIPKNFWQIILSFAFKYLNKKQLGVLKNKMVEDLSYSEYSSYSNFNSLNRLNQSIKIIENDL